MCLAGLLVAFNGLKQNLVSHELKGFIQYWQKQGVNAQPPSAAFSNHIEQRLTSFDPSAGLIRPVHPQIWLQLGQVSHWLAYFAGQEQNELQAIFYLDQAQLYYAQHIEQVPLWPYGVLLQLETEQQRTQFSDTFDQTWQAAFNHSQQHAQIQFALAKQIPGLWTRLNTQQKQQALKVFYQAANQSVHQARVLYRIEPKQAWLLHTTCLMLNKSYKSELCK